MLQQTEDLMRWAGQQDDPAWIRLLTGIGEKVGRPGIATYASVMAVGAPIDSMRTWAQGHGDDPLANAVWDRLRLVEGESAAERIERERLEARARDQRRKADDARSRALAKERGLRDPVAQARRTRMLTAGVLGLLLGGVAAVLYLNYAQRRGAELARTTTAKDLRSFMSSSGGHPMAWPAATRWSRGTRRATLGVFFDPRPGLGSRA